MPEDERERRDREWHEVTSPALAAARDARRRALRGQEDVVAQVEALLFRHDPIGINVETNTTEYRSEAESIVLRLADVTSETELLQVVHQEFVRWFDPDLAGPRSRYAAAASEIWALGEHRAGGRSAAAGDDRGRPERTQP